METKVYAKNKTENFLIKGDIQGVKPYINANT